MADAIAQAEAVICPRVLTFRRLERALAAHSLNPPPARDLTLDLSQCTFIEVSVLLYISAIFTATWRAGHIARLVLPQHEGPLAFLEAWRFLPALQEATGRRRRDLVITTEGREVPRPRSPHRRSYFARSYRVGPDVVDEISPKHLQMTTYRDPSANPAISVREARRWCNQLVLSVLNTVLGGHGRLFSSRIVYEALMNAVRHPDAKLVQLVAQFSTLALGGTPYLSFCVWDDGEGVAENLLRPLRANLPIRAEVADELHVDFDLAISQGKGRRARRLKVSSRAEPSADWEETMLILAATFPGVSRSPLRPRGDVFEDDRREEILSRPGMGLFILLNAVVATLRGTITVKSGRSSVRIEGASEPDVRQTFSVRARGGERIPLLGTLLVIHIPLQT